MKGKIFAMFAVFALLFVGLGAIGSANAETASAELYPYPNPVIRGVSVSTDKERYIDGEDVVITSSVYVWSYINPIDPIRPYYFDSYTWSETSYFCSGCIKDSEGMGVAIIRCPGTYTWTQDKYEDYLGAGKNDFTVTVTCTVRTTVYRTVTYLVTYPLKDVITTDPYTTETKPLGTMVTETVIVGTYTFTYTASAAFTIVNTGAPSENPGADHVPENQGTAHNPNL